MHAPPHKDKQRLNNVKTLHKAPASPNISVTRFQTSCILTLSQAIH